MQAHFFLQGKGGTGKSTTACFLAQYLLDCGSKVLCIDTDPVNRTLSLFPRLEARGINLMENSRINRHNYGDIMTEIAATDAEHIIVDNGASSFVSFSNYLLEHCWTDYLTNELHCGMNIHTVIVGGRAYSETLAGIREICMAFPEPAKIHVWVNPFFGRVYNSFKVPFEETDAYQNEIKSRISSLIYLPDLDQETFGHEISEIMRHGQTFAEAYEDTSIPAYVRFQLNIARRKIYESLDPLRLE